MNSSIDIFSLLELQKRLGEEDVNNFQEKSRQYEKANAWILRGFRFVGRNRKEYEITLFAQG